MEDNLIRKEIIQLNEQAFNVRYSNPQKTFTLGKSALELAQKIQDLELQAKSLRMMGIANIILGFYEQSMEDLRRSHDIYRQLNNQEGLVEVTANIGACFQRMGQYELALEWHSRTLPIAENLNNKFVRSNTFYNIGLIHTSLEQYDKAMEALQTALSIKEDMGDAYGVAQALNSIGKIYMIKDAPTKALEYYEVALQFANEAGHVGTRAPILKNIGHVYSKTKKYEASLKYYYDAAHYAEEISDKHLVCECYIELCLVLSETGQFLDAQHYGEKALHIAENLGNKENLYQARLAMSKMYEHLNEPEKALEYYKLYSETYTEMLRFSTARRLSMLQAHFDQESEESRNEIFRLKNIELANALKEIQRKARQIEEKNKDITASIHYARRIQNAFLPTQADVLHYLHNAFVFYKPKDIVCGDFFWVLQNEDTVFLAAVDCTGHGVPAALMSIIGLNLLQDTVINKGVKEPAKILGHLHRGVRTALKQETNEPGANMDGMDIALITIDKNKNELQYAGAFSPLYFVRRGEMEEIRADKFPIGGMQDEMFRIFTNHRIPLKNNELIYLASDGFANQIGGETAKRYSSKRFKELLNSISALPFEQQQESLEAEFNDWRNGGEQNDDIMIIGIQL